MIPCLAIPIYNRRDLLQRLLSSIDYPVRRLVVINNGKESLHDLKIPGFVVEYDEIVNGENKGCAGAWNQGLDFAFRRTETQSVFIVGNDIEFRHGDLSLIDQYVSNEPDTDFFNGNWAFSMWGVTRKGFEKLGWVDENYALGYLEDGDYWRRVQLSKAKVTSVPTQSIHGDGAHTGSMTINSDPEMKRLVQNAHARNWIYHIEKWGGEMKGNTERYTTPFNKPYPLNHWVLAPERLAQPHFRTQG